MPLTLFSLPFRKLSFRSLNLDELGGVVRQETAEFSTIESKQGGSGAGVAGVAAWDRGAHPELVIARSRPRTRGRKTSDVRCGDAHPL